MSNLLNAHIAISFLMSVNAKSFLLIMLNARSLCCRMMTFWDVDEMELFSIVLVIVRFYAHGSFLDKLNPNFVLHTNF